MKRASLPSAGAGAGDAGGGGASDGGGPSSEMVMPSAGALVFFSDFDRPSMLGDGCVSTGGGRWGREVDVGWLGAG